MSLRLLLLLCGLWPFPSRGQGPSMQRQVEIVRSHFEAGNYDETLKRAREVLSSDALTDLQRLDHRLPIERKAEA